MPVNLAAVDKLLPVPGIKLATASAEIKYADRADLVVLAGGPQSRCAGVFTQNSFAAAPVQICRAHLSLVNYSGAVKNAASPRALVINSGNANAATGQAGYEDALESCARVAELLGIEKEQVLPFSTGIIGERLPMDRLLCGIESACSQLSESDSSESGVSSESACGCSSGSARGCSSGKAWLQAACAIMTTDTIPKGFSRQFELDGSTVTLTGIAKGAGMLRPDMATMLAFVATDASISQTCLDQLLSASAEQSFNRITVDGDTSTNDSLVLISSCEASHTAITSSSQVEFQEFKQQLDGLCLELAQSLVRDAEGATRFVAICVSGAQSRKECLQVAYTIAESPLVKTALFAGDPNWGRFCMAIGRAGIENLRIEGVSLSLGGLCIAQGGELIEHYSEAVAAKIMQQDEYTVHVDLGRGNCSETIWTSDLSYEYIKINAEYRT